MSYAHMCINSFIIKTISFITIFSYFILHHIFMSFYIIVNYCIKNKYFVEERWNLIRHNISEGFKELKRQLLKSLIRVTSQNSWFKGWLRMPSLHHVATTKTSWIREYKRYDFIFDATGRRHNRASRENRADITAARDIQSTVAPSV